MITAHDLILDQFAPEAGSDTRLTTWYAQGTSDGLGDRLLMFDNTNAPSWEILRFKPALAHEPRFEAALRQRVELLSTFQHDAFPLVRPIKRLGHDDGLAVVSTYSAGAALSEALKKPRSAEFVWRLIRQLVPALAALQGHAPGITHGALTPDRIILGGDGRLTIREHMVASAIESLGWPADRVWSELGIVAGVTSDPAALDARNDIVQLALVALSLMAGRRIGPEDEAGKTRDLLDDLSRRHHGHSSSTFHTLRDWLERALELGDQRFESAQEAQTALADLHDRPDTPDDLFEESLRMTQKPVPAAPVSSAPPMWSGGRSLPAPVELAKAAPAPHRINEWRERILKAWRRVPAPMLRWAAVAVCVLAIAEAVVIGRLISARSAAPPAVATNAAAPSSPPPRSEAVPIEPAALASLPLIVTTTTVNPKVSDSRVPQPAAVAVRTGGLRISAPIELHVLDGERVIGSSVDGPIIAAAGRHEFEFVNSAIGYRVRQVVDVKAGQITAVTVPVPDGTLNINAQPWATVWIDGNPVGETPLGDLSVRPGEHEIVFRHPQLGERREKTIVRSGIETRVAVNLRK